MIMPVVKVVEGYPGEPDELAITFPSGKGMLEVYLPLGHSGEDCRVRWSKSGDWAKDDWVEVEKQ